MSRGLSGLVFGAVSSVARTVAALLFLLVLVALVVDLFILFGD